MKTKKIVCYNCGGNGFITTTYENGQTSAICPVCGGIGLHEIQMTNADRIRTMSDEELAKMLTVGKGAFACLECREIGDGECSMQCGERCLEWLQQPAEGG